MRKKKRKNSKIKNAILKHIYNNLKEYVTLLIIFLIGLVLGIIFINNLKQEGQNEIIDYITNFITSLKGNNLIDKGTLLKNSIKLNLLTVILLWFSGSTVIGLPIVYALIGYRGFCFGYSISSIIACLGTKNGIIFCFSSMLFQSILLIPAVFILSVSGISLYKSIMKDRRKENIKIEIYRHTILSFIMTIVLVISSFIESYISSNLILFFIKFI